MRAFTDAPQHWALKPEADISHRAGLELRRQGVAEHTVQRQLRAAGMHLAFTGSDDQTLQRLRIERDSSYGHVLEAVQEDNSRPKLDRQKHSLRDIVTKFSPLFSALAVEDPSITLKQKAERTARTAALHSERGKTLSYAARTVLATQVISEVLPLRTSFVSRTFGETAALQKVVSEQFEFGRDHAYGDLKKGDDALALIEHSMYGVLAERLNGQPAKLTIWLGRVAGGFAMAAESDRGAIVPGMIITGTIVAALRSQRAAAAFIRRRP